LPITALSFPSLLSKFLGPVADLIPIPQIVNAEFYLVEIDSVRKMFEAIP